MSNLEDGPTARRRGLLDRRGGLPGLLKIFDDGAQAAGHWKEWLKMAEEMEQGLKAYGHVVLRVRIDPGRSRSGAPPTARARAATGANSSSPRP